MAIFDSTGANQLVLNFPVTSLVGYSGGGLCVLHGGVDRPTGFGGIGGFLSYSFDALSGVGDELTINSLTLEAAAVPEPSTFAFIGTGVIGLVGAVRRRRHSRQCLI